MATEDDRNRDLIIANKQFTYIQDGSSGKVRVRVGPVKVSLSQTDCPVIWDDKKQEFKRLDSVSQAVLQPFVNVPEGHYVVLSNPALSSEAGVSEHPKDEYDGMMVSLQFGRTVNIPGPAHFALWPAQSAKVVEGHRLRSNEYLLVSVTNEEQARENWSKAVVKPQISTLESSGTGKESVTKEEGKSTQETTNPSVGSVADSEKVTMGQLLVVKGTEVAFYIPPTGLEVIADSTGKYVRDAVTLERLEYCILLDEKGTKEYLPGPAVVFPSPTQTFVTQQGSRKFKAIELNPQSGIHLKVIADYEENDVRYKAGEELILTGSEQAIYFPRPEHAIIKYDDREIHYAIAIPSGEARYVLNKQSGTVDLKKGPAMFLPDPREEVIVRRILDRPTVELWFPGNTKAVEINKHLQELADQEDVGFLADAEVRRTAVTRSAQRVSSEEVLGAAAHFGDEISRKTTYTPPRAITLDTKYDGAVTIEVWSGYAVLITNKTGKRDVVVGPAIRLLEYDESLMPMQLSTGKPKTTDRLYKTTYLLVSNNKVSDIILAETKDLCQVEIKVSYRVNFEGDDREKWFAVQNYVKLLTDHTRSLIGNAVKHVGIEEFNDHAIDIVRDTILGQPQEGGLRKGREFKENGMRIYDVEVFEVKIGDKDIAELLKGAQRATVQQALQIAGLERNLDARKREHNVLREIADLETQTELQELELDLIKARKRSDMDQEKAAMEGSLVNLKLTHREEMELLTQKIREINLEVEKAEADQELIIDKARLDQRLEELKAEGAAFVEKMNAVSPDFIAAIQAFSDKALTGEMAQSVSPLAILGGKNFTDVMSKVFVGTGLGTLFTDMVTRKTGGGNGETAVQTRGRDL